jgi:diguanylate cyclase (GGDEF)-like protein
VAELLQSAQCPHLDNCWRKVLLVDDDPAFLRIAYVILDRAGYEVATAADGQEAMYSIAQAAPDFLVTDWKMPGVDGIELCHWVRQSRCERYVYILMVSGRAETRHIVQAIAAGADEFMSKPIRGGELLARMQAGQRILDRERQLHFLACYDQLTELFNRRTFFERLEKTWHCCRDADIPLSCVMGDVDCFKAVNDQYGHLVGDQVLKRLAGVLRGLARPDDVVGRYGGEEFCILLPDTTESDAALWAEACRAEIAATLASTPGATCPTTISFGVAARGDHAATSQQLLQQADQALLAAKRAGKNRVICSTSLPADEASAAQGDVVPSKLPITAGDDARSAPTACSLRR